MQIVITYFYNPVKKIITKFGPKTLFYYGVVGGLSAGINFLVFAIFWDILNLPYKLAVTISYFLSVLFNFTCNRQVTFKGASGKLGNHACKYLTMILINYAITFIIVHIGVKDLQISPYLGLLISIVVTAFTGFVLSKFWVFSRAEVYP